MEYRKVENEKELTRRRGAAEEEQAGERSSFTDRRPLQRIAVAIVEHDGKFLVGLRPPGKPLAGHSEFPGGKVLPGETLAEAAARECREETGLNVVVGEQYPAVEHDYPHSRLELHFFRCTLADTSEAETLLAPFRWVGRDELAALEFPAANRPLLTELTRGVNRGLP